MTSTVITPSASIKKGITVANDLDAPKFPLLLSRILKTLPAQEKPFSDAEELKLQSSLSLGAEDVTLLLETLRFILKQAAFHLARPTVLFQELIQLGMNKDKATVMIEAWSSIAKDVVKELSQHSVAPVQLDDVNWQLHLRMAQASKSMLGQPTALFSFRLRNETTQEKENFLLEFSHSELYAFYNQLDTIQAQLDSFK